MTFTRIDKLCRPREFQIYSKGYVSNIPLRAYCVNFLTNLWQFYYDLDGEKVSKDYQVQKEEYEESSVLDFSCCRALSLAQAPQQQHVSTTCSTTKAKISAKKSSSFLSRPWRHKKRNHLKVGWCRMQLGHLLWQSSQNGQPGTRDSHWEICCLSSPPFGRGSQLLPAKHKHYMTICKWWILRCAALLFNQ